MATTDPVDRGPVEPARTVPVGALESDQVDSVPWDPAVVGWDCEAAEWGPEQVVVGLGWEVVGYAWEAPSLRKLLLMSFVMTR